MKVRLSIEGMHCEKCVARVTAALEGVDGVAKAKVKLDEKSAVVRGEGFETGELIAAVRGEGFEASEV